MGVRVSPRQPLKGYTRKVSGSSRKPRFRIGVGPRGLGGSIPQLSATQGIRPAVGQQPLKLTSGVQVPGPLPRSLPPVGSSSNGQDGALSTPRCGFDSRWPCQHAGAAQMAERLSCKQRERVRFLPPAPDSNRGPVAQQESASLARRGLWVRLPPGPPTVVVVV